MAKPVRQLQFFLRRRASKRKGAGMGVVFKFRPSLKMWRWCDPRAARESHAAAAAGFCSARRRRPRIAPSAPSCQNGERMRMSYSNAAAFLVLLLRVWRATHLPAAHSAGGSSVEACTPLD